ncbi:MAG TPA: hypothetical protein VHB53_13655 [Solirubrobacterales bacterium]|nr:hypothetical protein [Solirubrobacterales bacterium]
MAAGRFSQRGRLVLSAALLALSFGLLFATGFDIGLMMMAPAIGTVALLLVWPHPGLELIMRIAARRRPPRPWKARPPARRRGSPRARGGRLIAVSLGGRAPPASLCRI